MRFEAELDIDMSVLKLSHLKLGKPRGWAKLFKANGPVAWRCLESPTSFSTVSLTTLSSDRSQPLRKQAQVVFVHQNVHNELLRQRQWLSLLCQ